MEGVQGRNDLAVAPPLEQAPRRTLPLADQGSKLLALPRAHVHASSTANAIRRIAGVLTRVKDLGCPAAATSVRCGIQQRVQRLLHAAANHPVEVALDPLIINRDDIVQETRCSLRHSFLLLTWLGHLQFSQIRGPPAHPFVRKIPYVIRT